MQINDLKVRLKTYINANLIIFLFILVQILPTKKLHSQEWIEQKLPKNTIRNNNSVQWQKIEPNREIYQQEIIWNKIDIENELKENHYNFNKNSNDPILNSQGKFSSVSRSLVYKKYLYPEMSFWIPSSFKQSEKYSFTLTGQVLGNPTNREAKDYCSWREFWEFCSDSQYFFEATPINTKYFSLGINYSQQESFLGKRSSGNWEDGGQAFGFQLKTNLKASQGLAIIGNNLYNPYDKGGPNNKHPKKGEVVNADLGRSYLFLYSKAWDIGNHFNSKSPSLINLNAGLGNGRYKSAKEIEKYWINLGKYEPIFSLGLALNQKISFFTEYAGQYAGIGISLRPFEVPVTATFMLRDFQGSKQGIINCRNGDIDNCRTTIDSRLVFHF